MPGALVGRWWSLFRRAAENRSGVARVLYVTSFRPDMYDATGVHLVHSFLESNSEGRLLLCHEHNMAHRLPQDSRLLKYDLDQAPFLREWLAQHADIIPQHLGGKAGRCRCPWPDDPKSSKHRRGCVGSWFNKNASRFFRKIVSLDYSLTIPEIDIIVWIDSDCIFRRQVFSGKIARVFKRAAVFYFKSKDRAIVETGIMGFYLARGGKKFLERLGDRYRSGVFRQDERWDDSKQFQRTLETSPDIRGIDLAVRATGYQDVVPNSPLGSVFEHLKGTHSRGLQLMT